MAWPVGQVYRGYHGALKRTRPLLHSNLKVKMPLIEERLRSLMLRSLAGDASSYHVFLDELATHLRSTTQAAGAVAAGKSRISCRSCCGRSTISGTLMM